MQDVVNWTESLKPQVLATVSQRLKLHEQIFKEKQMHEIYKDKPRVSLVDDDKSMEDEEPAPKKGKPIVSDEEGDQQKEEAGSEQEEDLF